MENTEFSIPKTPNLNPDMTTPPTAGNTTPTYQAPAFGGLGIGGTLFVIFLVLKLAQVKPFKSWSWWRVAMPLWLPVAIVLVLMIVLWIINEHRLRDIFKQT